MREEKQKIQLENLGRDELKNGLPICAHSSGSNSISIAKYDEALVRQLIEKVTVYQRGIKSGTAAEVEA